MRMGKKTLVVMVLLLAASGASAERLYKWVDKQGRVSYHDSPPPADGNYRVEQKNVRTRGAGGGDADVDRPAVLLYSAPDCQSCDLAREYLKRRQVPFTEKNAGNDINIQDELKKRVGSLSVPVLIVGEKVMKGYLESLLAGELDAAGYPKADGGQAGSATSDRRDREGLAPAP